MDDQPIKEEYLPPPMDPEDPEVLKKKRRKRIVIILSIVFGGLILLGLIGLGIIYLIGTSITQICQNSCSNCTCDCKCDESCSESCSNSCSESCSNSCNDSCSSSSCNCGGDSILSSAETGDKSLNVEIYRRYVWETLKDWFHNLFG